MSQSQEAELRRMARDRIDRGQLTSNRGERTWAGHGSCMCCSLCGAEILLNEVEYEVEFAPQASGPLRPYRFHVPCHTAWISEVETGHQSSW